MLILRYGLFLYIIFMHGCSIKTTRGNLSVNKTQMSEMDKNGFVYKVENDGSIYKFKDGVLKFSQNYKIYGQISAIDVSNPMEIYIFYKETGKIIFLDNTLALRGTMDLTLLPGLGFVTHICRSFDNGIWLFDQADLQIKKLDKKGNLLLSSGNPIWMNQRTILPAFMSENGEGLYITDPENGIISLGLNGIYRSAFPIKGVKRFSLSEQHLFFIKDAILFSLNLKTFSIKSDSILIDCPPEKTVFYTSHVLCIDSIVNSNR